MYLRHRLISEKDKRLVWTVSIIPNPIWPAKQVCVNTRSINKSFEIDMWPLMLSESPLTNSGLQMVSWMELFQDDHQCWTFLFKSQYRRHQQTLFSMACEWLNGSWNKVKGQWDPINSLSQSGVETVAREANTEILPQVSPPSPPLERVKSGGQTRHILDKNGQSKLSIKTQIVAVNRDYAGRSGAWMSPET